MIERDTYGFKVAVLGGSQAGDFLFKVVHFFSCQHCLLKTTFMLFISEDSCYLERMIIYVPDLMYSLATLVMQNNNEAMEVKN